MKDKEGIYLALRNMISKNNLWSIIIFLMSRDIQQGLEKCRIEQEDLWYIFFRIHKDSHKKNLGQSLRIVNQWQAVKVTSREILQNFEKELFNPKVVGDVLIEAVQKLMNKIKKTLFSQTA